MNAAWRRYDTPARQLTLTLHVQPGAKKNEIAGIHGDALKVRIAAPATDNKANAALIEFLAVTLGVPKSAVAIRQGATSRRKVVEITGEPEIAAKFDAFAGG